MAGGLVRVGILVAVAAFGVAPPALADPAETTTFGGVIYADQNANGAQDSGEAGLGGVTVTLSGEGFFGQQTTNPAGRFAFPAIPTGHYVIDYSAPAGWSIYGLTGGWGDSVDFDRSPAHADVRIPAVRPLANSLSATLILDRTSYRPGDTVQLTAIVSNQGFDPVTGISITCDNLQDGAYLTGGDWGLLDPAGPGLTLAPGTTRSVRVSQPVPADAPRYGRVSSDNCRFSAAHHPRGDGVISPMSVGSARVPGVPGTGKAQFFQDGNGNNWPDAGEEVAGATVVVTDPDTGAVVASPVTDANGEVSVSGLPATTYDLRVAGPWQPRFGAGQGWFQLRVVAPEPRDEPRYELQPGPVSDLSLPNLKLSAEFDKPAYKSGELITARLTITNIGGVAATGVHANLGGFDYDLSQRGDLGFPGPGATIDAGASRTLVLSGHARDADAGAVSLVGWVESGNGETNVFNNWVAIAAPLTAALGTYAGTLYGDKNNNGTMDPGEALPRVPVELNGGVPRGTLTRTTDGAGQFSFKDIPTGDYTVHYQLPGNWTVDYLQVTIDDAGHPPVLVRATQPLSALLKPTVKFAKRSYAKGEVAHLTVTLTNTSQSELTGITTFCTGAGNGNEIFDGPGWGDLAAGASGVTVAAAAARTFDVVSTIPDGAEVMGYAVASCVFTAHGQGGTAVGGDTAKVPGQIGGVHAVLIYDRNSDGHFDGDGVADTKVVLLEPGTGQVVARTRTDAAGKFGFTGLPAGGYDLRVIGPWKVTEGGGMQVFGGRDRDQGLFLVVPGAMQPDPDDVHPPAGAPAPQGGVSPQATHLASTGASVLGWAVGGLAALGLGLLLLLFRRRGTTG